MLSVVIPSYNEEGNIKNTAQVISRVLDESKIEHELIFVDDGSKDSSWDVISAEHERDERIRGIRFSRNFGKEGAIFAGLEACRGDAAVVMDCDLQHPPQVIPEMYELWQEGAQVVDGKKSSRGSESLVYRAMAGFFYRLIQSSSKIDMKDSSDFKLIDRRVIDTLLAMPERITFFRALSGWVGFDTKTVYYDVAERFSGERKWTAGMLIGYAIRNLTSFTGIPLYISSVVGLLVMLAAVVLIILNIAGVPMGSFDAAASVLMLIGGGVLECIGIGCYYISRIYEEVKHRPRYIVAKTTEDKKGNKRKENAGGDNAPDTSDGGKP